MSYDNRNTYEMKPRKKRSISYYVVWYFICLAVLVVIMLIKGEFSWSRLLASVVFVAVLSVIWYFTEGFIGCKLHGCEYVAGISRISTLADYVRHNSYASHLPAIFKPQIGGVYSEIFVI